MARVKQTAHKSGGAPPCLHLATKAARAATKKAIAMRKPHRWRPVRLVLILAGAVCNIWVFVLVHTYACVGLYLFSTVIYCRLALKNEKQKISLHYGYNKNSYCPILCKIYDEVPA